MLSGLRSLLRLVVDALGGKGPEPRPADGVVVVALVMILVAAGYTAFLNYALTHPDAAPDRNRDVLEISFWILTRICQPVWVAFLLSGLLARKHWPHSRLLAHALAQFWFLQGALWSYLLGPFTDIFFAMTLFVGTVTLLALLGTRIASAGIATFLVVIVATTAAERLGILPYAPAFAEAPYRAGQLSTFSFWWGVFASSGLVFAVLVFVATTQRLRRATDLIRRYVPVQLAEKILAGEHTGTAQPERRKVTLFFSDVVGFTDAADRMEAEDLSALLNDYLSEMARIADAFGATVNQFVGDGIMIFFGAPEATTDRDHALRAVRMALAMQQRMVELGKKWFAEGIQTPFRIRIGINTGVASVGDFGSEGRTTYSAIGNQTNLTARIQAQCDPGKVLISHTTWALVKDQIPCKQRGEIEVKGLHYSVRIYEVVEEASLGCSDA